MSIQQEIQRQHLIDPQSCMRCSTCEDTCPSGAISNDRRNFAVDPYLCDQCGSCVAHCPTGAINVWRPISGGLFYSTEEQFTWDALPDIESGMQQTQVLRSALDEASGAIEFANGAATCSTIPVPGTVCENRCLTAPGSSVAIHHIVIEVAGGAFNFLEGQSVGVKPPGFDQEGRRHTPRLYSIASPRGGENGRPGRFALTVRRVIIDNPGERIYGVCSNFLCDRKPDEQIDVLGPYGTNFLMPADDSAPLITICAGTGIAPMRAMLKRRERLPRGTAGQQILFYGSRTPEETPYLSELRALSCRRDVDIAFVFSRVPGQSKRHVQHAIQDYHDKLAVFLRHPLMHIYVCGPKGMEKGVLEALGEVCSLHRLDWDVLRSDLTNESRLHMETY